MAVSGVILIGYVIGHLLGNLQLYAGPEVINAYAVGLRQMPALLWGVRILLLVAVVAHISAAVQLANRNADARPTDYGQARRQTTTYAARTMYWSGPILLLYIVYHVLHLTLGFSGGEPFEHLSVYDNVVYAFRNPLISAAYIAGNLALGFHLYHGAWSFFQSLGANHPRYNRFRRYFATAVAVVVTVGNLSFPISVLTGQLVPTAELERQGEEYE